MKVTSHDLKSDTDAMSIQAKSWPAIYPRRYPSGRVKWIVDLGKQGERTRDRRCFNSRGEANTFAQQARAARINQGKLAFMMPSADQAAAVRLYEYLKPYGISLDQVQQHYATDVIPYIEAPPVSEIVDLLIQTVESKRRDSTVRSLKSILGEFSRCFGNKQITDIRTDELEQFCFRPELKQRNSAGTKRNRWAKVSQLYNFAIKRGWATKNLALGLDVPPADDDREPVILTIDEVRRLLAVADEFGLLGYIVLAVFLGIRPKEILRLNWSDVYMNDGVVVIKKAAAKIHQRREVPINETAAAWLALCSRSDGPIVDPKDFGKRFKAVRKAAGIKSWTKDVLRHCYATYSVAYDDNPAKTANDMGHIGGLRILRKHYVAYVPKTVAKEFWAIRPTAAPVVTTAVAA